MIEIKPFLYSDGKTPDGYVCKCGASNVRLYREYQTFLNHQELSCTTCAIKEYNETHHKPWDPESSDRSSEIGWLVAAVPTEDGSTFWGYTSVPQDGVDWWDNLPVKESSVEDKLLDIYSQG